MLAASQYACTLEYPSTLTAFCRSLLLLLSLADQCPCYYPDNYASNKRWCCGECCGVCSVLFLVSLGEKKELGAVWLGAGAVLLFYKHVAFSLLMIRCGVLSVLQVTCTTWTCLCGRMKG